MTVVARHPNGGTAVATPLAVTAALQAQQLRAGGHRQVAGIRGGERDPGLRTLTGRCDLRDRMPVYPRITVPCPPPHPPPTRLYMTATLPPLEELIDRLPDTVCVVDCDGRFLFVSAGFERMLGYTREEVLGRRTFEFVHPDDRAATMRAADEVMAGALQRHFRNRYLHKDGRSVDIQWSAQWHAQYGVRIAVAREVTELRRAERELEHRASHDPLTGLPNRHRLQVELHSAIGRAAREGNGLAVLYVDLDGFKAANDHGGHDVGDRLLCEVAHRLQQGVRQRDLVARVGGDEFVVLLPGCTDRGAAHVVAEALRGCLRTPFQLPDGPITLDASIGIACHPGDGATAEALLTHADRAMFHVKRTRPCHDRLARRRGGAGA